MAVGAGELEVRGLGVPSNWDSEIVASGSKVDRTSGEELVR